MTATIDGPRVGPASGGPAKQLVVLLHGYGSNGADLIGLVPYWQGALPDAVFVSPNAPQGCPGAPGGYQWWSLGSLGPDERAAGARAAAAPLDAFLDKELAAHGLADDKLALVGFSQGTMMALQVGPGRKAQIAGMVGYSGMLADPQSLAQAPGRPPVLLVHGDADDRLPLALFHEARAALEGLGFPLETHVSRGLGHSIDMDGLKLGEGFLKRVLG